MRAEGAIVPRSSVAFWRSDERENGARAPLLPWAGMRTDQPAPPTEPGTTHELVVPAEQLVDVLSCPICLELLKDPLIAACCQNNFCRQCLKNTLLSNPVCPLCRTPLVLENTLPNRAIRNLLPLENRGVETGGEAQTFKPTNLSKRPNCVLLFFVLLISVSAFVGRTSSDILDAACLSPVLNPARWACRVSPDGAAQPVRGGNALEPTVPWGRVATDDTEEVPRLLRFSPVAVMEAEQGGDNDLRGSSSAGDGGDGGDRGDALDVDYE